MSAGVIAAIVLGGLLLLCIVVLFILLPCRAYFTALFSGCYIPSFKLIAMKMCKIDVMEIVHSYILAKKSHLGLTVYDLEIVFSSGGHPLNVVEGLNAAKNSKVKIDFDFAKAVDIAGRDVIAVVRECISPKTIELPLINSVAQDNVEINVKVSLTLKVNLSKFLTGATEETIAARAVEAVVTRIANTVTAKELVSRPQLLDKAIFDAAIDEDCKYTLVSADVIHIDLGNNRGIAAEKEQIEKNRILAANQMEQRRLMAVAVEQEMKAKAEEMRVKAIEAEAEVPKAIVKAIEEGKMKDVVDYYKIQNLQADTEMRRNLFMKKNKREE